MNFRSTFLNCLIHFRFRVDNNGMYVKNDDFVECPDSLQLNNKDYILHSVVNNHGSRDGGHYTCNCRIGKR